MLECARAATATRCFVWSSDGCPAGSAAAVSHLFVSRSRIKSTAAIIAFALAAGGCVTAGSQTVKTGNEQLQASQKGVAAFDQIGYESVEMGKPLRFAVDENLSYIETAGRRRFLKGFRLPAWSGSYALKLSSFRLGTPADPAILYPDVRVLDAQFREVGAIPASAYLFRTLSGSDALTTTFFFNSHSAGETYVVISERRIADADLDSTQQNVTSTVPVSVYGRSAIVTWMIPTGSSTAPVKMAASPVGQLEITFEPYRPLKVGE